MRLSPNSITPTLAFRQSAHVTLPTHRKPRRRLLPKNSIVLRDAVAFVTTSTSFQGQKMAPSSTPANSLYPSERTPQFRRPPVGKPSIASPPSTWISFMSTSLLATASLLGDSNLPLSSSIEPLDIIGPSASNPCSMMTFRRLSLPFATKPAHLLASSDATAMRSFLAARCDRSSTQTTLLSRQVQQVGNRQTG